MNKLGIEKAKWRKLKKIAEDLFQKEGNVKQEVFNTHFNYIEKKEGKEGVKKVKKILKELGVKEDLDKIESFEWVREVYSALCIVIAKIVFDWTETDVFKMGAAAPKASFVFKMFFKYFASPKKVFKKSSTYWKKHYDFASLEPVEYNDEKNYFVLRIKEFKFHPLLCIFQAGYIKSIAEISINSEEIKIEETKCMFDGDPYHEFKINY